MVTGGSPRSTGVFYDDSYDRNLSAPGSNCAVKGTEVVYDESIDIDPTALDGGGGINPAALPVDGSKGCTPVYPHSFLRVNTIFEVARDAGLYTAWSDKHPAYEIVNGPSGSSVNDLYTPEIAAVPVTVSGTEPYDDLKATSRPQRDRRERPYWHKNRTSPGHLRHELSGGERCTKRSKWWLS